MSNVQIPKSRLSVLFEHEVRDVCRAFRAIAETKDVQGGIPAIERFAEAFAFCFEHIIDNPEQPFVVFDALKAFTPEEIEKLYETKTNRNPCPDCKGDLNCETCGGHGWLAPDEDNTES